FKQQNPLHQFFRMNHFVDRFSAIVRSQPEVAPVFAHFGMEEILVDGSEFGLERFAQLLQNLIVSAHDTNSSSPEWTASNRHRPPHGVDSAHGASGVGFLPSALLWSMGSGSRRGGSGARNYGLVLVCEQFGYDPR